MTYKIDKQKGLFVDSPKVEEKESVFWRGFKVTCNFIYETPSLVFGLIAGGILAHIFLPEIAITCYALAIASMGCKLVIKLITRFDVKWLQRFEQWAWKVKKKIPYIQTAMIICSLVISYFVPVIGVSTAVVVGVYNGIIFEMEYYKKLQSLHKETIEDEEDSNELLSILV